MVIVICSVVTVVSNKNILTTRIKSYDRLRTGELNCITVLGYKFSNLNMIIRITDFLDLSIIQYLKQCFGNWACFHLQV